MIFSFCTNQPKYFILIFRNCKGIITPTSISINNKTVGHIVEIRLKGNSCLGKATFDNGFIVKKGMKFNYYPVLVGDPYLEIQLDSTVKNFESPISIKDTIIVN